MCRAPSAGGNQAVAKMCRHVRHCAVDLLNQPGIQIVDVDVLDAEQRLDAGLPGGAEINARPPLRIIGAAAVAIVRIGPRIVQVRILYRCPSPRSVDRGCSPAGAAHWGLAAAGWYPAVLARRRHLPGWRLYRCRSRPGSVPRCVDVHINQAGRRIGGARCGIGTPGAAGCACSIRLGGVVAWSGSVPVAPPERPAALARAGPAAAAPAGRE